MRGGSGGGEYTRGGAAGRTTSPVPREGEIVPSCSMRGCGIGWIRAAGSVFTVTGCSLLVSRATRSRFRIDPRCMPKPAEPGVMVTRFGGPATGLTTSPFPTITVVCVRIGGWGMGVLAGGLTTRGIGFQVFQ